MSAKWLYPFTVLALAFSPACFATDPPTPPTPPPIILPEVQPVAPVPAPSPSISTLNADELYVISCADALQVVASPEGIVNVTEDTGPIKIRAKFAGNTKPSTRTVKEAHVYSVEAVSTGRVELLITRLGQTKPAIRRTLDVTVEPVPPGPGPGPNPPGPNPPGPTPTPAPEGFRVIFVYETSQALTPPMQRVMFGEKVRSYLDAKSKSWRRWDKDVDATNEKDAEIKALWQAARPKVTTVPCVIVAVGGKADIIPLPADEDEALTVLKKYGGQ